MNNSKYIAVIQAGGKGTRMVNLTNDVIPKPMLLLNGKPLILWQIENLSKFGVERFIIIIGHLGFMIKEYFGDGSKFGVYIEYIEEKTPMGSAGSLFGLKSKNNSDYILIFGDVMFCLDWNKMIAFHEKHHRMVTLLAHPNSHPYDSDLLLINDNSRVVGINSKESSRDYWYNNCVNAGIYIFKKELLDLISKPEKTDFEKDILVPILEKGSVYAYITPEYVKDVGTPKRFYDAQRDQTKGIWEIKCLKNPQKCIFIDRDGTINKYKGLIFNEADFELEDNVCEAIKIINESGYLAIVITNQPVVARGLCSLEDVDKIHKKMVTLLGNKGAYLDDIVFCPHHPDKGYPEENVDYKKECNCRKPKTGMIDKMVKKYNIDLSKSYIIGDSTLDIQTGVNAGLKTILLKTGMAGRDCKYSVTPDFIEDNLFVAIKKILGE